MRQDVRGVFWRRPSTLSGILIGRSEPVDCGRAFEDSVTSRLRDPPLHTTPREAKCETQGPVAHADWSGQSPAELWGSFFNPQGCDASKGISPSPTGESARSGHTRVKEKPRDPLALRHPRRSEAKAGRTRCPITLFWEMECSRGAPICWAANEVTVHATCLGWMWRSVGCSEGTLTRHRAGCSAVCVLNTTHHDHVLRQFAGKSVNGTPGLIT